MSFSLGPLQEHAICNVATVKGDFDQSVMTEEDRKVELERARMVYEGGRDYNGSKEEHDVHPLHPPTTTTTTTTELQHEEKQGLLAAEEKSRPQGTAW